MANPMYGQNKDDGQLYNARAGVIVNSGARTLLASESGSLVLHNSASTAITLPAAKQGLNFKIVLGIEATSGCNILTASNADCFFGYIPLHTDVVDNTGVPQQITYAVAIAAPASYDAMKFVASTATIGGVAGEVISLVAVSSVAWFVDIPNHTTSADNPATCVLIVSR